MKNSIRSLRFFGVITLIVYWCFTIISISQNSWFSVMHNALSDLGANNANAPWLYNYGLILSFPFLFIFSIYLLHIAINKLQIIGGAFIMISSVFLAFIGIFHSGTRPHGFVSTYFFLQFFFGMFIFGIATEKLRIASIVLFALSWLGAFLPWPSVATLEIYEISIIGVFVILIALLNPEKLANIERSLQSQEIRWM